MMELGNVRAAVTVVRTIRDDWDQRSIQGQIEQMSLEYPHADVLYAAVTIAEDRRNGSPVTLSMKAGEVLNRLHAKTPAARPGKRRQGQEQWLCDVCGLTRDLCEQQAGNLDGSDHQFKTIKDAEAEREKQRYVREYPQKRDFGIGKLPADVTHQQHPEPEQEAS